MSCFRLCLPPQQLSLLVNIRCIQIRQAHTALWGAVVLRDQILQIGGVAHDCQSGIEPNETHKQEATPSFLPLCDATALPQGSAGLCIEEDRTSTCTTIK